MTDDRRRYRRITGPYDGNWDGSAGVRDCRITDLSGGGCFVDSFGRPEMGDEVVITVVAAGRTFTLPGKVVHVDRVQGFGVRFDETEAARLLAAALDTLLS